MLPTPFLERMKHLLKEEFPAFLEEISKEESVRAFRIHPQKMDPAQVCALFLQDEQPIADLPHAFYTTEEKIGLSPKHHAGLIYMQDPSAMSTVQAVTVASDAKIFDVCAAPGGKTGQLSALVPNGQVLANEYVHSRAKILQGNIERLGCKNVTVTEEDTASFAPLYADFFDLVLVDAPCSGEGMFRKYTVAQSEWKEENIPLCAKRQKEILSNVIPCVKAGGQLLYSTCTFSIEENEAVVAWLLDTYPDFVLTAVPPKLCKKTADGILFPNCPHNLALCRRFYPHKAKGEGQFIALFTKKSTPKSSPTSLVQKKKKALPYAVSATEKKLFQSFLEAHFDPVPTGELMKIGNLFFLQSTSFPLLPYGVLASGVALGSLENGRVVPHHQLFSAYGSDCKQKISLAPNDPRLLSYLHGDVFPFDAPFSNGYCTICVAQAPLGLGKYTNGMVKNHYPKGLRNP